jgi:hypothetical protein
MRQASRQGEGADINQGTNTMGMQGRNQLLERAS